MVEGEAEDLGEDEKHEGFDCNEYDDKAGDREWLCGDQREVDAGTDGEKENSEEKRLERLDVRFKFVPIGAAGQHDSGDEGPQSGGQADRVHKKCGADDQSEGSAA